MMCLTYAVSIFQYLTYYRPSWLQNFGQCRFKQPAFMTYDGIQFLCTKRSDG